MGRRIEKNVDGTITRYLYSNEGLIAEYDINNNLKKSYGWMPNGIWGTDPLYMTENNQTYFYHNDGLGTPQKMTDASGNVVWSATYTAFGEATVDASSTITSNLRFAGQYFDQETGINYNLFRVYDPKTGTYISKDPIGFKGRDINLYIYVHNRPTFYVDPYGLYVWPYSWKGWAAVTLGGAGAVVIFIPGGQPIGAGLIIAGGIFQAWDIIEAADKAEEDTMKKLKPIQNEMDELKKELENQEKDKCPNKGDKK